MLISEAQDTIKMAKLIIKEAMGVEGKEFVEFRIPTGQEGPLGAWLKCNNLNHFHFTHLATDTVVGVMIRRTNWDE